MGSRYSPRTLSEGNYFNHIEDDPNLFNSEAIPAIWQFDNSNLPLLGNNDDRSSQDSVAWNGHDILLEQEKQRLNKSKGLTEKPVFIPNPRILHMQEGKDSLQDDVLQRHEWFNQIDRQGNHQIFDEYGNLLQQDKQGIYRMIDDDGNLLPLEELLMSGLPKKNINHIQMKGKHDSLPITIASPAMSGNQSNPSFSMQIPMYHQHQEFKGDMNTEEGEGDNGVQHENHDIKKYYGRPGMRMLNRIYRINCGDDRMTEEQADLDLSYGMTFDLAKESYNGSKYTRKKVAQNIYTKARLYGAY